MDAGSHRRPDAQPVRSVGRTGKEVAHPDDRRFPEHRTIRLHWWKEMLLVAAFYGVYTQVRNTQGSNRVGALHAFTNARRLIRFERWTGMFHEESAQEVFLRFRAFIQFWNVYYGTFHFAITFIGLVWCYRRLPYRYPRMRNMLLATTAFALVGFALFPLMPPRLLPPQYGFVDTLKVYGGLWSFDSGPIAKASNQYAAMPSLHFAWSAWCAIVLWPWARTSVRRAALVAYPLVTVYAIVVTANHYIADALGGAVVLVLAYRLAIHIERHSARRALHATAPVPGTPDTPDTPGAPGAPGAT